MPSLPALPPHMISFVATVLLAFVLGLELHSYRKANKDDLGFGTTRTLTLMAALGYLLWLLDPSRRLYATGLALTGAMLGIYYWRRSGAGKLSLLSIMVALLVFLIGPLVIEEPAWMTVLYVVMISLLLGEKPEIRSISNRVPPKESVTLAKFLILSGLVLPLLPKTNLPMMTITWDQLWLAVIVVSGLSYFSYLLQTYFFPTAGVLVTGILGGLYSSTATTVVLARRAGEGNAPITRVAPALVMATAMMYLRLLLVILVLGHRQAALHLALPFGLFIVASLAFAGWLYRRAPSQHHGKAALSAPHPLELPTAFLFALLFIVFAALTQVVISRFGAQGLHVLSFAVGFTDIDPFILGLLAGKFHVSQAAVESAVVIASGSNNLLKAGYAALLSRRKELLPAITWLVLLTAASLAFVFLF